MIQLAQNQLWKKDDRYFRIVIWERLAIRYKETDSPEDAEGTLHDVSKKNSAASSKARSWWRGEFYYRRPVQILLRY